MNFRLTDMQEEFRSTARKFFKDNYSLEQVKQAEKSELNYLQEIYMKIAELGFAGLIIPEQYGGFEAELLDLAFVVEEAGAALFQSPLIPTIAYGIVPIVQFANEQTKQAILPSIATGEVTVTGAIAEPQAHYNVEFIEATAMPAEKGYHISGTKIFAPFANGVDKLLVLAKAPQGLTAFLVNREEEGVVINTIPTISGDGNCEVVFNNVYTETVIGLPGEGAKIAVAANDYAIALQSVEAAGLLRRTIEMTASYVKERHQFKVPIGAFQSVQHRLSDMFTIAEGANLAAYNALAKLASGQDASKELAVAKLWISKEGHKVVTGAHQLHGGMGLDYDYPLQFCYRRLKGIQLTLGTPEIHLRKLAKSVIGEKQPVQL
ncbi:MAG: acyl-CoA dehydrogenase family protein [Lysinibacillus sp.]